MRQHLLAFFSALMIGLMSAGAAAKDLPDFTDIVEKADPAVVNIRTTAKISRNLPGADGDDPTELFRWFFGPDFRGPTPRMPDPRRDPKAPKGDRAPEEREMPRGVGSGFVISADGYILTNHHVVDGADDIYVTFTDKRELKAKVIGSDQRTDVALIKVEATGLSRLPIGDPNKLKKGEWVLAIGSPFGLESTVTAGIVSAKGRETGDYLPFIQTDAAVNPGNSGGPLLNMKGEVIGINSQIISRSGGFQGISLAIPIDEANRVAEQLKANGRVTRGRIGVAIGDVTKETAEAVGLPKPSGALVTRVEEDSPAEKAGVEVGDVVLKFDGRSIEKWSDLPRVVGGTKPGTKATIQVWRKGAGKDLSITIGEMEPDKTASAAGRKEKGKSAPEATNVLGLVVSDLQPAKRKELRRSGVLVEEVDGPAARAGIQPGDVILSIGSTEVTGAKQFNDLVAKLDRNRNIGLLVVRGDASGSVARWVTVKPAAK